MSRPYAKNNSRLEDINNGSSNSEPITIDETDKNINIEVICRHLSFYKYICTNCGIS